jgi:hypothetical protein
MRYLHTMLRVPASLYSGAWQHWPRFGRSLTHRSISVDR